MKRPASFCVVALCLGQAALAYADNYHLGDFRLAPLNDPWQVEFQGGAKRATQDVEQAVRITGATRGWKVVNAGEGRMELTNVVRDKHAMSIEVTYGATGYRIRYLQSTNLLYGEQVRGRGSIKVIHGNYNGWISGLVSDVNAALSVPVKTTIGFAPLESVDAIPFINQKGREFYAGFLAAPKPRAFAIAPNGAWGRGIAYSSSRRVDVVEHALEMCNRRGNGECRLYALDSHVVWH
jgi:hypothetical protein